MTPEMLHRTPSPGSVDFQPPELQRLLQEPAGGLGTQAKNQEAQGICAQESWGRGDPTQVYVYSFEGKQQLPRLFWKPNMHFESLCCLFQVTALQVNARHCGSAAQCNPPSQPYYSLIRSVLIHPGTLGQLPGIPSFPYPLQPGSRAAGVGTPHPGFKPRLAALRNSPLWASASSSVKWPADTHSQGCCEDSVSYHLGSS